MRRKRWIVILAALAALVIGVSGGAVMAQGGETDGGGPVKGFVSKVASILGLDDQQVKDAFNQAAREIQDERLQLKLDRLVEAGKITQEQADEYKEWYEARPPSLKPRFGGPGFGGFGHRHGRRKGGSRFHGFNKGGTDTAPLPGETSL